MWKFINKLILFFTLFIFILFFLNYVVYKKVHQNDYYGLQYDEISNPRTDATNVIIGTSHSTHGIQPKILNSKGNTFYNFSLNGANPAFYFEWYKKIFKPNYRKPKYMIFAVDWFLFDDKKLFRKFEQDSEYFPDILFYSALFRDSVYDRKMLLENRYPILKYRKQLFGKIFNNDISTFPISTYDNGFIAFNAEIPKVYEFYPDEINIDKKQVEQFEKLIEVLNNDGIRIIFVVSPTYNLNANRYVSNPVYTYFEKIAAKYSFPFVNYNAGKRSFINSNKSYFSDGGHLNYLGSKEFSKLLRQDLEKIIN